MGSMNMSSLGSMAVTGAKVFFITGVVSGFLTPLVGFPVGAFVLAAEMGWI
jgi:hypothetical protein